ncbi:hypothetical protein [Streptomyces sp. NPDC054794]
MSQIGGDDGTMGGKYAFREAIRAVRLFVEFALADVRAIRDPILRGGRMAEAGQDPETGGWGRLENVRSGTTYAATCALAAAHCRRRGTPKGW